MRRGRHLQSHLLQCELGTARESTNLLQGVADEHNKQAGWSRHCTALHQLLAEQQGVLFAVAGCVGALRPADGCCGMVCGCGGDHARINSGLACVPAREGASASGSVFTVDNCKFCRCPYQRVCTPELHRSAPCSITEPSKECSDTTAQQQRSTCSGLIARGCRAERLASKVRRIAL